MGSGDSWAERYDAKKAEQEAPVRQLLQEALETIDVLMDATNVPSLAPDDVYMAAGNTRDRIKDFLDGDEDT